MKANLHFQRKVSVDNHFNDHNSYKKVIRWNNANEFAGNNAMNEHEASVANRMTERGNPLIAAFTVWAMKKREAPKGVSLRTITLGSAIAAWPMIHTALKTHGWL